MTIATAPNRKSEVSVAALARHFDVSPGTVYNWLRDGLIPGAYRIGPRKRWRIPADALDRLDRL